MSIESKVKKHKWGGLREGAGRDGREGGTAKICVSVNKKNWNTATEHWKQKPSWLVDQLVLRYIETDGSILKSQAAL